MLTQLTVKTQSFWHPSNPSPFLEVFQSIQSFTHLRVIDKKSADLKVIEFDYCEKVIQLDYRGISEPA